MYSPCHIIQLVLQKKIVMEFFFYTVKPLYSEQSRDQKNVHYTGVFTQEDRQGFYIHASSSESYSQHQQKYQTDYPNFFDQF